MMKTSLNAKYSWLIAGFLVFVFLILSCTESHENPPTIKDGVSSGEYGDVKEPSLPPDDNNHDDRKSELEDWQYTVVVSEFQDRGEAEVFCIKLKRDRINVFMTRLDGAWSVCVGKYRSLGRAERTLQQVHEKGYLRARIRGPEI